MTMLERVQAYLNEANKIKPDWEKYVVDKTQPLDERWTTYWAAPKEWRIDVDSSNIPVDCLDSLFDSPYDDFNMDRSETKSLDDIINFVEEKLRDDEVDGLTQELIDEAKEEIMAEKLGEWEYDW